MHTKCIKDLEGQYLWHELRSPKDNTYDILGIILMRPKFPSLGGDLVVPERTNNDVNDYEMYLLLSHQTNWYRR